MEALWRRMVSAICLVAGRYWISHPQWHASRLRWQGITPMPRSYTLSDKALQQRRAASPFARKKRAKEIDRSIPAAVLSAIRDICAAENVALKIEIANHNKHKAELADYMHGFPPLPPTATFADHQRRAALIRGSKIRKGEITGAARGGRPTTQRECARCQAVCDTARGARDHCRVARKAVAELIS